MSEDGRGLAKCRGVNAGDGTESGGPQSPGKCWILSCSPYMWPEPSLGSRGANVLSSLRQSKKVRAQALFRGR